MNGHIEKCDGDFVATLPCDVIGDPSVVIGPAPSPHDTKEMAEAGITGVLNL